MLVGFRVRDVVAPSGAVVRVRVAGEGPPVLLLHGWPQTSAMWHRVAPALAGSHAVVLADLPGYGESTALANAPVEAFGKRAWAAELVAVMGELGFAAFAVVGHDRGARCAYRMALDHPSVVTRLAVLDILPTGDVFDAVDASFALGAWHWFLLAQPADLPERLIGGDPDGFFSNFLRPEVFAPEALEAYRRSWSLPQVVRAMCQDYRAGASFDVADDEADRGRRLISCPTLVLWGADGPVGRHPAPLRVWRQWSPRAEGHQLPTGHYLAEEAPEETTSQLGTFLGRELTRAE